MTTKIKRSLLLVGALLFVAAGLLFLIPTSRMIIIGYVRGEPFHEGRPIGFWIYELQLEDRSDGGWSRIKAATALGEMGPKAVPAVPALTAALQDKEKNVRRAAAIALGRIGPEARSAAEALIQATPTNEGLSLMYLVDHAAILVALGDEAIPAVIKGLRHENSDVRFCAAYALTRFGLRAKVAIPALIEGLNDPVNRKNARRSGRPDETQRLCFYQMAVALGEMGPEAKAAAPVIVSAIKDGIDPIHVRTTYNNVWTFTYNGDEPLLALQKIDPDLASVAGAVPGSFRQPDSSKSERNLGILIGSLRHEKSHVREFAAFTLGWCMPPHGFSSPTIGPRDAFWKLAPTELTRALKDDDEAVRYSAAIALVRFYEWNPRARPIESPLALPVLIEALSKDKKHARVRYLAAYAIGQLGGQQKRGEISGADVSIAAPALMEALNDPDLQVRLRALFALAEVGSRPEHVQAVVRGVSEFQKAGEIESMDRFLPNIGVDLQWLLGRMSPDAVAKAGIKLQPQPAQNPAAK